MKQIIAMLAIGLAISSCTTTSDIDAGIQKALPQVCAGAATSYAIVKPFIDADKLKPKTVAAVNAAHDSLFGVDGDAQSQALALCNNTKTASLTTVLIAASSAALTISTAVSEAKKAQ